MSEQDPQLKGGVAGWIDAAAAAERLGVKTATLYAYVSRGVLTRRHAPDGNRSLFNATEIEALARRGRPRHRPGPPELAIESAVTKLGTDRPYYRGQDAIALATSESFENVAELLWTGALPDQDSTTVPWQPSAQAVRTAVAAQSGLGPDPVPIDRLALIVAAHAVSDPMRFHLEPEAVTATGRLLIAGMIAALPNADGSPSAAFDGETGRVATALWPKLSSRPPTPAQAATLEAALILLADHELAASTLAARVAASVHADPYAVVMSGLGVLTGPMHGGASLGAERMLADAADPADAPRVIAERLRRGDRIPGLGHTVYKSGDTRGTTLMDLVRAAYPDNERLAVAEALVAERSARHLPALNIDFALAAFGAAAGLIPGAGQAVFAIARTAGWLAHALEEYQRRSPLRPRAVYVGPEPA
jgi:citrate synthase